jgi:hypothetical protein
VFLFWWFNATMKSAKKKSNRKRHGIAKMFWVTSVANTGWRRKDNNRKRRVNQFSLSLSSKLSRTGKKINFRLYTFVLFLYQQSLDWLLSSGKSASPLFPCPEVMQAYSQAKSSNLLLKIDMTFRLNYKAQTIRTNTAISNHQCMQFQHTLLIAFK